MYLTINYKKSIKWNAPVNFFKIISCHAFTFISVSVALVYAFKLVLLFGIFMIFNLAVMLKVLIYFQSAQVLSVCRLPDLSLLKSTFINA